MSIQSEVERIQGAKNSIKTSIENKGVTVPYDARIDEYAPLIDSIQAGGGGTGNLQSKTVIPDAYGTSVFPDQGYDGLSQVDVMGDPDLVASNIKSGVEVFGVVGTYGGGGSGDYNVFVQDEEPETKNGVWLKTNRNTGDVKFSRSVNRSGAWLEEPELTWLTTGNTTSSFNFVQLVGNKIYIYQGSKIYICDLETKTVTSMSFSHSLGQTPKFSFVYGEYIYMYASTSPYNKFGKFNTNTLGYEVITATGVAFPSNSNFITDFCVDGRFAYLVDSSARAIYTYDIDNNEITKTSFTNSAYNASYNSAECCEKIGNNLYYTTSGTSSNYKQARMYKIDLSTNIATQISANLFTTSIAGNGSSLTKFGSDLYIYQKKYGEMVKYDTVQDTLTELGLPIGNFDDTTNDGKMTFLSEDGTKIYAITPEFSQIMSLVNDEYASGTVVILETSIYNNYTVIDDESNLGIPFGDAWIVGSDGNTQTWEQDFAIFLGNGTGWVSYKNAPTYTVTFNSNGGSEVESQIVQYGEYADIPTDPVRDGYLFAHWELNGEEYFFTQRVTSDITLDAVWTQIA